MLTTIIAMTLLVAAAALVALTGYVCALLAYDELDQWLDSPAGQAFVTGWHRRLLRVRGWGRALRRSVSVPDPTPA